MVAGHSVKRCYQPTYNMGLNVMQPLLRHFRSLGSDQLRTRTKVDEIVRDKLNEELLKLWHRTQKTIGFVTHSIPEAVYLSTHIVVMSPRPGRITDVIESPLPRGPRPLEIRETPEFLEIAQRVREGLHAGHAYEV